MLSPYVSLWHVSILICKGHDGEIRGCWVCNNLNLLCFNVVIFVFTVKVCEKRHILRERKGQYVKREKEVLHILSLNQKPNVPFFVRLQCTFQDMERLCILALRSWLIHQWGRWSTPRSWFTPVCFMPFVLLTPPTNWHLLIYSFSFSVERPLAGLFPYI